MNKPYSVELYTASSSAPADYRLVVLSWKTPQAEVGNASYKKPPAVCIAVPRISLSVTPSFLQPALLEAFEDMQDSYFRASVSEKAIGQRIGILFSEADCGPQAIASWMARTGGSGNRLSKEVIEDWFNNQLADTLTLALASRMALSEAPSDEEVKRLETAISQRRLLMTKIAGPGKPFADKVATQLLDAAELAPESRTKNQVVAKLRSYLEAPVDLDDLL